MDQFYLKNAAYYQSLVNALNPTRLPRTAKEIAGIGNPNMIVSARIRPVLDEDLAAGFPCAIFPRRTQSGVVDIHDLYNQPRSPKARPVLKSSDYHLDRIFSSRTTTEEIYENLVADLIPFAWNGGIGTLFAYGQTGSGKTYTVSRLEELAIDSLITETNGAEREVYMTIIELAGQSAFDLSVSRKPISILEDSFGVTQLAGAVEHLVETKDQAMQLIESAASFRRTESTWKNDSSSRSHGICRLRIVDPSTGSEGFLYLIDLAGSEAARDIAIHGADRMKETREINISLSTLKDCIRAKSQSDASAITSGPRSRQKKPYVPFRQSALTKVLKHMFDPIGSRACKTVVIACINPSLADVGPSRNTLRYAETLRVLVPAVDKTEYDSMVPTTRTGTQLRDWIAANSGTPRISPDIVAKTESVAQFLRLPVAEFETRCLESPGVGIEQAKAFHSKLWRMHIDSQRGDTSPSEAPVPSTDDTVKNGTTLGYSSPKDMLSSRDPHVAAMTAGFKERIRPGMVISWKQLSQSGSASSERGESGLAVVLCPAEDTRNNGQHDNVNGPTNVGSRYLCAVVAPGMMHGAYELSLWRQLVVDVDLMEKEVILEYDTATRYYFISI